MNTLSQPLTLSQIKEALLRIRPLVHKTPLQSCRTLSEMSGKNVYLKLENMQKTGSFKLRGAANMIYGLQAKDAGRGIICASAGNHAQGVAWAAKARNIPAVVVMPSHAPHAKVRATEAYGAKVYLHGASYDDAYAHALQMQQQEQMKFIHAFDDEAVMAGQGTIALEIMAKLFDVDAIVAPVGGGGLLAGIAVAVKEHNPKIKVIGVQAAGAAAMAQSLKQGSIIGLNTVQTIADGIAVKRPGDLTFQYIKKYVDDIVTVTDEEIQEGMLYLLERGKLTAEGAGAAGVAALLAQKLRVTAKNMAVLVSGGNVDPLLLSSIITARHRQSTSA
ncbi:threonine ammonia-lyase [Anaerospora sp.]|uniref:threonine ammonia-lyase n=1 Tax=Anaerospora sp. TaxID=1960278 RepID=UPI00289F902B|nr:threonine ammonia-lyase [Anaerospora sp.]